MPGTSGGSGLADLLHISIFHVFRRFKVITRSQMFHAVDFINCRFSAVFAHRDANSFFTELLILLLFVVLFSQPIREDLVIAAYCPFIYMYVCFANPPQTFPGIQPPTHAILNILRNLSLLTCI